MIRIKCIQFQQLQLPIVYPNKPKTIKLLPLYTALYCLILFTPIALNVMVYYLYIH